MPTLKQSINKLRLKLSLWLNPMQVRVAGEPSFNRDPFPSSICTLFAGEDITNDRMNVTILEWSKMVNNGWRTKLDLNDKELRDVRDSISKYLDHEHSS